MTKQEVADVVLPEIVQFGGGAARCGAMTEKIVEALWASFILLHQGEKAELPESCPTLDIAGKAPACATCGNTWGGFVKIAPGVFLCPQCLDGKRKESAEGREFWEKVLIAIVQGPRISNLTADEYADLALKNWLKRFGERVA